jgi:transposase
VWDRTGWLLVYKRLENGTFRFPVAEDGVVEIDAEQLRMLLDGIELGAAPRRRTAL